MRHTVELEGNRKATVEIPYSKLMGNSNYQRTGNNQRCCEEKVIQLNCGGCKSTNRSSNYEIQSIIADLQTSYDKDVKALEQKVALGVKQNSDLKASHSLELQKLKNNYELQLEKAKSTAELLKGECKTKDSQIASLINEKEIILRSKINEFKQNEYLDKIRQLQDIISRKELQIQDLIRSKDIQLQDIVRLKDLSLEEITKTKGIIISELTDKLDQAQKERVKIEEERLASQIKWEGEIKRINNELTEKENKYSRERLNIQKDTRDKEENHRSTLQKIEIQLQSIRQRDNQLENKLKSNLQFIKELQSKLSETQQTSDYYAKQLLIRNQNIEDLANENKKLIDKLQISEEGVLILDSQKGDILIELNARLTEIDSLKKELSSKQKVVQVKIERVIDGKAQIDQLRKVISELEMQLKQFGNQRDTFDEQLKRKENIIIELRAAAIRLEAQVSELRLYIEKREGSFKWAVERQIEKDMAVTDVKGQIYKVSQVKQYLREVSHKAKGVTVSVQQSKNIQIIREGSEKIYLNSYQKESQ